MFVLLPGSRPRWANIVDPRPVKFYRLALSRSGHPGRLVPLPMPQETVTITGLALSPDGSKLAAALLPADGRTGAKIQVSSRSGYCGCVDEKLLAGARRARERLIRAEQSAEAARAGFRGAVHRLIVNGSRSSDVAAALGLSGQELDEMVQVAGGSGREDRAGTPGIDLACSFCGRSEHEVRKLIAGPGCYICEACVALTEGVASAGSPAHARLGPVHAVPEQDERARCSFCGKHRCLVTGLAVRPGEPGLASGPAAICTECLSLCNEILAEELA
jgi:hypothetical protein